MSKKKRKPHPVRSRKSQTPDLRAPTSGKTSKHLTAAEVTTLRAWAALEALKPPGETPSTREVSAAMGLSEQGAQRHLIALATKGALEEIKELRVVGRKMTALGKTWLKMPN